MTGLVVGFTVALTVWAAIRGMCHWSDRKMVDCQARALRTWEARQCPDRLERCDADSLACAQVVAEAEDITREAAS